MAVANETSASASASSGTTITVSGFTASGTNRLVLGLAGSSNTAHITGMTYGGSGMTYAGQVSIGGVCYQDLYYIIAPSTSASDVVATWGTTLLDAAALLVISFSGVHQTSPLSAVSTASDGSSASVTGASASASTGDLVFDSVSHSAGGGATISATGTGHTKTLENNPFGGWNLASGLMTGTGTISPTWTISSSQTWSQLCTAIKVATGASITIDSAAYTSIGIATTLRVGSPTWLRYRK